jgi:hypothetical protein
MKIRFLLPLTTFIMAALSPLAGLSDHSFFPIYNISRLKTTGGDTINFYSPGINYTYNAKRNFGLFSSLSLFVPVRSKQNGESFRLSEFYDRKLGGDLTVGAGGKIPLSKRVVLVTSGGAHLNGIRLRGNLTTTTFYNLSLGVGLNLQTRYQISKSVDGTLFASGGWDFIDLIHQDKDNKLQSGTFLTLGIGLTF